MTATSSGLDSQCAADKLPVAEELVQAALRAAEKRGKDVADVPVLAIAREAGISRSTLLRRLSGTRAALDEAVRAAGVDPGGQVPVRTRALNAAAALISESGLAAATLEAIATRADCSVHSLYMAFGSRDELLRSVFERYSPIPDLEDALDSATDDLTATVQYIYQALATALIREPRVGPAVLAEAFARPDSPAVQTLTQHAAPRMLGVIGVWLTTQVQKGRIRDLPIPLLIQQLMGPMVIHMLARPALATVDVVELPDMDTVCTAFAANFVRAVAAE
ncbi:TetR family transcriptional regulator [Mycobacterium sp. SM1]|uniref:TetR family transcriptional regulator n=1 Tax=Mycobacterium sp. SM1 TaxID=2816243 RepID=UPI001BCF8E7E|nr:TetR family transcriptional regulator [Mycobacterium sp. SM1]MBS4730254.1 TetR family transcriptional regulator [Mycobacterium sp. SM1]